MKKVMNKKGFTILELLVVVAIIAILAVIATPQFLDAIEKSRVSAQIADLNAVSKAATMYNFDNSVFPTDEDDFGTYINAFPAASKWSVAGVPGAFDYKTLVAADVAADADADNAVTGLEEGAIVIHVGSVPAAQAAALDTAIDQVTGVDAGLVRVNGTDVFYVIAE